MSSPLEAVEEDILLQSLRGNGKCRITIVDLGRNTLDLNDEDQSKVEGWMAAPPSPESVDPTQIPLAQRELFLDSIEGVITSDGDVAPEERENFALLRELLV